MANSEYVDNSFPSSINNNSQNSLVEINVRKMSGNALPTIIILQNEPIYEFRKRVTYIIGEPIYNIRLLRGQEILQGDKPIYIEGLDNEISLVVLNTNPILIIPTGEYQTAIITFYSRLIYNRKNYNVCESDITELKLGETFTMIYRGDTHTVGITSLKRAIYWINNISINIEDINMKIEETFKLRQDEYFTMISAGDYQTAAITSEGRAFCWDHHNYKMIKIPELKPGEIFTMISAGGYHIAAITSLGRAICWGIDNYKQVSDIPTLGKDEYFTIISAGECHTAAITSEGRAVCWGWNPNNMVLDVPELRPDEYFRMISAGDCHTATITSSGSCSHSSLELNSRAVCWGDDSDGRALRIPELRLGESFTMISAGLNHNAAITSDGRAVCWGMSCNKVPELSSYPVGFERIGKYSASFELNGLGESFTMISAGISLTAVITSEGRAVCWGEDFRGQISRIPKLRPGEFYKMISAGSTHISAITSEGRIVCWGDDDEEDDDADDLMIYPVGAPLLDV